MHRLAIIVCAAIAAVTLAAAARAENAHIAYRPDSYDLDVCSFLEKTEELSSYIVKGAYFATKGNGPLVRLSLEEDGTLHLLKPTVSLPNGNSIEIAGKSEHGRDGIWRWSYNQRWLIHGDRAYILRFGDGTAYLKGVARLTEDFREVPLCKFETSVAVFLKPSETSDDALCDAVSTGQPDYLLPTEAHRVVKDGTDNTTRIIARLDADVANDGHPATVYLYQMVSAEGRGCGTQYFDTAEGENAPLHARLRAMQGLGSGGAPYCGRERPRWFTFAGRTYLESLAQSADRPRAEEDEYHTVSTIEQGLPRIACSADYSAKTRQIVSVWTGADWSEKGVVAER